MDNNQKKRGFFTRLFYDEHDQLKIFDVPSKYPGQVVTAVLACGLISFVLIIGSVRYIDEYIKGQRLYLVLFFLMGLCFVQLTIINVKRWRFLWKLRQEAPYPEVLRMPYKTYVSNVLTDAVWLIVVAVLGCIAYLLEKMTKV